MFDLSSSQWKSSVAYPFGYISFRAPTIHFNGYFYTFASTSFIGSQIIASFDPVQERWKNVGKLLQNRKMSRAILNNDKFMIAGDGTMVEICSVIDDSNGLS